MPDRARALASFVAGTSQIIDLWCDIAGGVLNTEFNIFVFCSSLLGSGGRLCGSKDRSDLDGNL